MQLSEFISTKQGYTFVLKQCAFYSFQFNINQEDLLSLVMYRIAISIQNKIVINDVEHAHRSVKFTVVNQCKDIKRGKYNTETELLDNEQMEQKNFHSSPSGYEHKQIFQLVDSAIRKKYSGKKKYLEIYERCLLGNEGQDKVADEIGVNKNTLRGCIRYMQAFAKSYYATL